MESRISTVSTKIASQLQRALDIKRYIHGNKNLAVATAEEDLSYALYVLEYSSGNFQSAKDHICKSIDILKVLLPTDHLLLSSARRVKALILEEIALDSFFIGDITTGTFSTQIKTIAFTNRHRFHFRISKSTDRSRRIASVGAKNNHRSIWWGERSDCQTLWQFGPSVPEHGQIWGNNRLIHHYWLLVCWRAGVNFLINSRIVGGRRVAQKSD